MLSREYHSNHLCHSLISHEDQHSDAHSMITKKLTRASRSNTGTERIHFLRNSGAILIPQENLESSDLSQTVLNSRTRFNVSRVIR